MKRWYGALIAFGVLPVIWLGLLTLEMRSKLLVQAGWPTSIDLSLLEVTTLALAIWVVLAMPVLVCALGRALIASMQRRSITESSNSL